MDAPCTIGRRGPLSLSHIAATITYMLRPCTDSGGSAAQCFRECFRLPELARSLCLCRGRFRGLLRTISPSAKPLQLKVSPNLHKALKRAIKPRSDAHIGHHGITSRRTMVNVKRTKRGEPLRWLLRIPLTYILRHYYYLCTVAKRCEPVLRLRLL